MATLFYSVGHLEHIIKRIQAMERWKFDKEVQKLKYFHYIKQRGKEMITVFWDVSLCDTADKQQSQRNLLLPPSWQKSKLHIIIKPMRCTNSQIYFWNRTLHVLDRFSAHHQESSTVHTAIGVSHTGFADCLLAGSG